ncbi:unnamed protein product [Miscanthus lutarioriparius]|uniref:(+)-neomenthol dehydrogenase n=1 Tax=Miscanthus lutarioriparius TaxID=422564 RepID=A0A811PQQ1_9POAL|nr:unnamed protein product [Miscanthus lutarioriparius]
MAGHNTLSFLASAAPFASFADADRAAKPQHDSSGKDASAGAATAVIAMVTGGNRGIGLEICKQLASNGVTVVLTARDEKRGAKAVSALGLSNVVFHELEVNNEGITGTTWSVGDPEIFRQKLAGMDLMERIETINKHITEPYEEAEKCLRTNYNGIKAVAKALLPLLQSSSHRRIVNMSSDYGLLRFFSRDELKEELNNIDSLSEQRVDELSELFLKDFKDGQLEARGWPKEGGFIAYKASKALANAYSRILAKEHPSLCINCVHPGYVETDMNFQVGHLTVEEGARGALMMAMAPKGGVTGAFLDLTEVAPFV